MGWSIQVPSVMTSASPGRSDAANRLISSAEPTRCSTAQTGAPIPSWSKPPAAAKTDASNLPRNDFDTLDTSTWITQRPQKIPAD
jgi:hypothetical protein